MVTENANASVSLGEAISKYWQYCRMRKRMPRSRKLITLSAGTGSEKTLDSLEVLRRELCGTFAGLMLLACKNWI